MAGNQPTILIQLDTDPQPSVFDSVVAVDSGVEQLFRHGGITPENVTGLVHGALFTRGPADLHRSAIFIGGSNVAASEAIFEAVKSTFFGPFRVSVLFDANGSNTTAAAAVLSASKGMGGSLDGISAAVLGATGPVGERVARLLGRRGVKVAVGSRDQSRAEKLAEKLRSATGGDFRPFGTSNPADLPQTLDGVSLIVSAGAAGACLLPRSIRENLPDLKVMIDLNAVPPLGIEGIEATDKDKLHGSVRAWGALGVGGLKMKIHRKAIQALFESNDKILDAEQVLELGQSLT
ncbi:MAG: MtdA bifunctional protein [Planctomycetes bacterium SCN 63-9]|nr:MAG: MtdA bifunctional protein [Planctomycetes bacterium SCN 63-9]